MLLLLRVLYYFSFSISSFSYPSSYSFLTTIATSLWVLERSKIKRRRMGILYSYSISPLPHTSNILFERHDTLFYFSIVVVFWAMKSFFRKPQLVSYRWPEGPRHIERHGKEGPIGNGGPSYQGRPTPFPAGPRGAERWAACLTARPSVVKNDRRLVWRWL